MAMIQEASLGQGSFQGRVEAERLRLLPEGR